jgi:maltose alpha-D-glucosyltransferase/alpha-amylase
VRVRSFADSDGDGIGDFRGLTGKLDYIQDLGVTAIWLLPFYPSPLRDDGYDISDYASIHPDCGTLQDFKLFLREAHGRGLRVITELVINHTSDQHPWFQRARRAPAGSKYRDFYMWSETPDKYAGTRIIFQDFEPSNWTWDPLAKAYYWHRFYSHQPDLNFDSPDVRKAVLQVLDFWFDLGVDGLRLDAIPYLYEREDTNCENLPETHAFLRQLRKHVDDNFDDRLLLAEANQWPEDAVAYFGSGDECHMSFHFPIMPRLFMSLYMEDRYPIIDILEQTPEIPANCQWGLFLRNHDELTLEMVTDEERDYMYRVYAHDVQARINLGIRRRLAPLLGNDRRRIELMNALLFSLPGTPILYYGDEIGMGDNIYLGDRNGVRTPMQWSPDRNAGFSVANPQRLILPVVIDPEYNYETINVESQKNNLHSLLWWMKRMIALRRRYKSFGWGAIRFLSPSNRKVLAFLREHEGERLLVVVNLSRFVQYVELDLHEYQGMVAVELFGQNEFPAIGELPYLLTLGPHAFYWFSLESRKPTAEIAQATAADEVIPTIALKGGWETVLRNDDRTILERALPSYLRPRRWFAGKAQQIRSARIVEDVPISSQPEDTHLTFIEVEYFGSTAETYVLPLTFVVEPEASHVLQAHPRAVVARLLVRGRGGMNEGLLCDATDVGWSSTAVLDAIGRRKSFKGKRGALVSSRTRAFRELRGPAEEALVPAVMSGEQSNTSIVFGQRLVFKLFRRMQEGLNPDLEVGRFLTERTSFSHIAPVAGAFEYKRTKNPPVTVGILQAFVVNQGNAWSFTLDAIERFVDQALTQSDEAPLPGESLLELTRTDPPNLVRRILGAQLESAYLLGQRTAEMHLALATDPSDPAFAPEPMTALAQRSLYQSMRNLTAKVMQLARERVHRLPRDVAGSVREVIGLERQILKAFQGLRDHKIAATRTRIHGDYHLGQVLYTGKDFVLIDFEGEPERELSERRRKRSPLRDVAGMLRSFNYAAHTVRAARLAVLLESEHQRVERWLRFWCAWASSAFVRAYLRAAGTASFIPRNDSDLELLLNSFLLEKSVYELGYELNNRPDWVHIPIRGIKELTA